MNLDFCFALQINEVLDKKPHISRFMGVAEIYDAIKNCGGISASTARHFFVRQDNKRPFSKSNYTIRKCETQKDFAGIDPYAIELVMATPAVKLYHHVLELMPTDVPF